MQKVKKRKHKEIVGMMQNRAENLVTKDVEKAEVANAFLTCLQC